MLIGTASPLLFCLKLFSRGLGEVRLRILREEEPWKT